MTRRNYCAPEQFRKQRRKYVNTCPVSGKASVTTATPFLRQPVRGSVWNTTRRYSETGRRILLTENDFTVYAGRIGVCFDVFEWALRRDINTSPKYIRWYPPIHMASRRTQTRARARLPNIYTKRVRRTKENVITSWRERYVNSRVTHAQRLVRDGNGEAGRTYAISRILRLLKSKAVARGVRKLL